MLRYYPSFRVKTDLITNGSEFSTSDGKPYRGKYYATYDGRIFTGANPIIGSNEELFKIVTRTSSDYLNQRSLPNQLKKQLAEKTGVNLNTIQAKRGAPVPYFPIPTDSDYKKGYLMRSFIKKVNDVGFVTEISDEEYANFENGTVDYDVSYYLVYQIMWKLTGPLNSVRLGQYDTRAGIIDTNKRLVEQANKTFLGITDFIGGDYAKFSRPTTL
jgi:hypothetical protein